MEITEIKQRLSIQVVLKHYGIQPDRNHRIRCPFHDDKTPSMQVYDKTNTVYCFSSNCPTHGKAIDVIDFIMLKENTTKHAAIEKAKTMINLRLIDRTGNGRTTSPEEPTSPGILEHLEKTFSTAIWCSEPAKQYSKQRGLKIEKLKGFIGYNSGQFHHSSRKNQTLIAGCVNIGMLHPLQRTNNQTGENITYKVFAKSCLTFMLRDKNGNPVGLYGRSIHNNSESKHFYLKNRRGLYPHYPKGETTKLILTESIIDAASLLQIEDITNQYAVLALYGTNGLTEELLSAVKELEHLQEIIFMLDNDAAGKQATAKHCQILQALLPSIKYTTVDLPGKDVNETLQLHEDEKVFTALLGQRKPVSMNELTLHPIENNFFLSNEKKTSEREATRPTKHTLLSLEHINTLIEQSGIVGEENSRLLLFIIASSYKTTKPLHAIVQGSSGSGKTHLIGKIADLMPPEDVLRFTRITESSLYNWGEYELVNKLLLIEDLDGLKEEAMFAMRELISNQKLSSSVSIKDKKGNIKSTRKEVLGVFSSLSATTKGGVYEDNMSRSFLLAVDESRQQSERVIAYQNKKYAGEISPHHQEQAREQLQNMIRNLMPLEVINPYATKLQLPEEVHKIRRLNEMFQSVVRQITLINGHQRELKDGKLIAQPEDLIQATEILFESIVLKVDELDGSLRQFFERLKKYVKSDASFTQREIRQAFNMSKAQCSRYIAQLSELEYLTSRYAGNLRKVTYKIDYRDDYQKLRMQLKEQILQQVNQL